jgi:hypothetical protein
MRALIAAGVLLPLLLTGCGEETDSTAEASSSLPAAPQGMRWVGMNDVVVAVPDWWTTGETRCGAPLEDTVYFDNTAVYDCADPVSNQEVAEVSSLAVIDASRGTGEYLTREMQVVDDVSGHDVMELEDCNEWFEGVCRRLFAVPDEGVLFAVSIADPEDADYEAIRDSLRILPPGQTTVPLATAPDGWTPARGAEPVFVDQIVAKIERAGLHVERQSALPRDDDAGLSADFPEGTLLDISPPLGSVVEDGATVTVTVLGAPPEG